MSYLISVFSHSHMWANELSPKICVRKLFLMHAISTCTNVNLFFLFFCSPHHSYGIFSFGLIFLVEGRGILQATLTLNGLVGGILLGLFSLGIFFPRANVQVRIFYF